MTGITDQLWDSQYILVLFKCDFPFKQLSKEPWLTDDTVQIQKSMTLVFQQY